MAHHGRTLVSTLIDTPENGYANLRIDPQTKNLVALLDNGSEVTYLAQVTHFGVTGFGGNVGTQVMGAIVESVTLNWNYNKLPLSQSINGNALDAALRTITYDGLQIDADTGWNLQANTADEQAGAGWGIHFANYRYWGTGPAGITDPGELTQVVGSDLNDGVNARITVNADLNSKIYYLRPARFGPADYNVGGFSGGFDERTVSVTNENGFTEDYIFGESTNPGLGQTTVTISNL